MAPRAQFRDTVMLRWPSGGLTIAPQPAGVVGHVYDVGTVNPISEPIYADASSPTTLANPVPLDATGTIDFWLAEERQIDLVVTGPGFSQVRVTTTTDSAGSAIDSAVRTYVQRIMSVLDPSGPPPPSP
jgi:hypothetical protein